MTRARRKKGPPVRVTNIVREGAPKCELPSCHGRVKWDSKAKQWCRFCTRLCHLKLAQQNGRWQAGMALKHSRMYDRIIVEAIGHKLRDVQTLTARQVKTLLVKAYRRGWSTGYVRRQNEAAA